MINQHSKPELSIVILCYKAEKSIIQFIEQIEMELKIGDINNYELVLVANYHDKRFDSTPEIVKGLADTNPRITVVTLEKKGMLGWDVRMGIIAANGDSIALIDGDGQMPPKDIIRLYNVIKSGEFDFIKTYRIIRYDGFYRKTSSIIFNLIFKILFPGTPYRDINSKPKLWTREAIKKMDLNCDGWFIDGEMILEANFHQFTFAEIPTEFYENEWRGSFVKTQTVFEMVFMMFYYRIKYWLK